jgi:hypothetical protein
LPAHLLMRPKRALRYDRRARVVTWTTSTGPRHTLSFRGHENRVGTHSLHWVLWLCYHLALYHNRNRHLNLEGTGSGVAPPPMVPTEFLVDVGRSTQGFWPLPLFWLPKQASGGPYECSYSTNTIAPVFLRQVHLNRVREQHCKSLTFRLHFFRIEIVILRSLGTRGLGAQS